MAHGFLRTPPQGDGRPDPLSDRVIARAVDRHLDGFQAWLKPRIPALDDAEVAKAVTTALRAAGADGFRMAVVLKNEFSWPADMGLALLLRDVTESLAFSLRIETSEWAMRTGFRFPGKSNQQIVWADHNDKLRSGTIVAVDNCYASALVQGFEGLVKAGEPRRVLAERVVSNITTDEHGVSTLPDRKGTAA
ncbi:hypothetical protein PAPPERLAPAPP_01750 [Brevundimonas phage vB_BpoS-Papperlapapp]|uniref:Uncharacterized protein n=2 Tax=Marchewkavirus TaxID=3425052 RepID=A0A9E7MPU5_9CAUD|nr:hypothetical protein KABACHOK_00120 [Brevundimonas phage vB_BpoS-Kabachok]USN14546.1 hypothetical protein DOMOVOI_00710 [Brevundimonas phage vB_BpoS-Domovoi]USN15917.1 hypothetical protein PAPPERLAPAPP_01750 [Brevundimonas phage vB_BpoS-Papperlapapp]